MAYFEGESPKFSQAKDSPNFAETLRSVLSGVKQAISRRCEGIGYRPKVLKFTTLTICLLLARTAKSRKTILEGNSRSI